MIKKRLAVLVLAGMTASVFGGLTVSAEDSSTLKEVVVDADKVLQDSAGEQYPGGYVGKSTHIGILGQKDNMDVPIKATSITAKAIEQVALPNSTILEAVTLDPEVRSRGGNAYNDITVRGFNVSPHDFFIDGIPGLMCQSSIPANFIERIDVISGPANITNGSTSFSKSALGAIDFIPKKATSTPIRKYTETFSGRSSWTEGIDIGQRFGDHKEWGVRINAELTKGTTFRQKEKMTSGDIFIDVDYDKGDNRANFFYGHNHVNESAPDLPLRLSYNGVKQAVPDAVKGSTNFQASWANYKYNNDIVGLSYEHDFSKHLTGFIKGGYHDENWYSCFESYYPTLMNDKGDYESYIEQVPLRYYRKTVMAGLKGDFHTGFVKHNVVFSVDKQWMTGAMGDWAAGYDLLYYGNIYNNSIEKYTKPYVDDVVWESSKEQISKGLSLVDTMEVGKWNILMGLRHQSDEIAGGYHASANSPSFGVLYKINDKLSAYGNWMQGLIRGQEVSNKYANRGDFLDPVKTTQREVGLKWDNGNIGGTVSYFHIGEQMPYADPDTNILSYNGRQQSEGVSVTVYGAPTEKFHLMGGLAFMNVKNIGGTNDGKRYHGAPRWNATLAMAYDFTDRFSMNSRILYNSSAWVDDANTRKLDSWVRFDLGAKYKWTEMKHPITLSCDVINLFGHKYWYGAGSDSVYLGAPRTAVISLGVNF